MSAERIEIKPYDHIEHFMSEAALLVSMSKKGKPNVMALLYKTIGEIWGLPIITIGVAPYRYTFELLTEGVNEFTVNIPSKKTLTAISIAGNYSGKNVDKFEKANLEIIQGKRVKVPIIKDCILNYECKIVHSCKSGNLSSHHLFFGEILTAYTLK